MKIFAFFDPWDLRPEFQWGWDVDTYKRVRGNEWCFWCGVEHVPVILDRLVSGRRMRIDATKDRPYIIIPKDEDEDPSGV